MIYLEGERSCRDPEPSRAQALAAESVFHGENTIHLTNKSILVVQVHTFYLMSTLITREAAWKIVLRMPWRIIKDWMP